ncbi:hypothetical protein JXZ74_13415, partial [Aeromonas media]
GLSGLLFDGQV